MKQHELPGASPEEGGSACACGSGLIDPWARRQGLAPADLQAQERCLHRAQSGLGRRPQVASSCSSPMPHSGLSCQSHDLRPQAQAHRMSFCVAPAEVRVCHCASTGLCRWVACTWLRQSACACACPAGCGRELGRGGAELEEALGGSEPPCGTRCPTTACIVAAIRCGPGPSPTPAPTPRCAARTCCPPTL